MTHRFTPLQRGTDGYYEPVPRTQDPIPAQGTTTETKAPAETQDDEDGMVPTPTVTDSSTHEGHAAARMLASIFRAGERFLMRGDDLVVVTAAGAFSGSFAALHAFSLAWGMPSTIPAGFVAGLVGLAGSAGGIVGVVASRRPLVTAFHRASEYLAPVGPVRLSHAQHMQQLLPWLPPVLANIVAAYAAQPAGQYVFRLGRLEVAAVMERTPSGRTRLVFDVPRPAGLARNKKAEDHYLKDALQWNGMPKGSMTVTIGLTAFRCKLDLLAAYPTAAPPGLRTLWRDAQLSEQRMSDWLTD